MASKPMDHPTPIDAGDDYARAMQMAFGYLSFKPRAITEVRRRIGRDFTQLVVERVLDSLKRYGYLDDAEYAMQWRRSRDKRKPRGAFVLRRELRAKGVADNLIDDALDGLDEASSAYRAGQRRAQRWLSDDSMSYATFRRKMWAYLGRRGFAAGVTRDTANRLWRECRPQD